MEAGPFELAAFVIGPGWIVLVVLAIRRYGRRALWALIGFPFALRALGDFLLLVLARLTR